MKLLRREQYRRKLSESIRLAWKNGNIIRQSPHQLFWKRVQKGDCGCWEWGGKIRKDGYGKITIDYKSYYVHRIAYEEFFGRIPETLVIDHLCKNRKCCNPLHVEVVTLKENVMRGDSGHARNARKTHCKRGHEFNSQNTVMKRGARQCRECINGYRKRKKA